MLPAASSVPRALPHAACLAALFFFAAGALAQTQPTGEASDIRVGPSFAPATETRPAETLRVLGKEVQPAAGIPQFAAGTRVIAIASAIGGELNYVVARPNVGSNRVDAFERTRLSVPDRGLDAIVMRGMDRVIERRMPGTERVFMRLNPIVLTDVAPQEREKVALERLMAEISNWPQRQQWDQIIVVTPHYRLSEIRGMASKLQGIGVFVQNQNNENALGSQESDPDQQVLEPDGSPGKQARKNFVGLYYYAMMTVLDAKTMRVLDQQPWLINEKYYDSQSAALRVEKQFSIEQLAEKLEQFSERASDSALTRTLGGKVEPGVLQRVPASPAK